MVARHHGLDFFLEQRFGASQLLALDAADKDFQELFHSSRERGEAIAIGSRDDLALFGDFQQSNENGMHFLGSQFVGGACFGRVRLAGRARMRHRRKLAFLTQEFLHASLAGCAQRKCAGSRDADSGAASRLEHLREIRYATHNAIETGTLFRIATLGEPRLQRLQLDVQRGAVTAEQAGDFGFRESELLALVLQRLEHRACNWRAGPS